MKENEKEMAKLPTYNFGYDHLDEMHLSKSLQLFLRAVEIAKEVFDSDVELLDLAFDGEHFHVHHDFVTSDFQDWFPASLCLGSESTFRGNLLAYVNDLKAKRKKEAYLQYLSLKAKFEDR